MDKYILGIDYGTSLTKVMIFDHDARIMTSVSEENKLYYPQPGWVEQDPDEILETIHKAVAEAFKNSRILPEDIEAIGISNQMATTIFWNKYTGDAVGRAIVWQDNRTQQICEQFSQYKDEFKARTGTYDIVPNCSSTKIRWLMENDRAIQRGLARGELLFGTIDTWIVWKLSGGAVHISDYSNLSLSLLFNTHTLTFDDWLVNKLQIPREILPEIHSSSEIYAYTRPDMFFNCQIPLASVCGDQFAAVFGQACNQPGMLQCNLGTGSSVTLNTGSKLILPHNGVASPIIWAIDSQVTRGLGCWTNYSGSTIKWLRDELGIIKDIPEAEVLATRVPDTAGVYFVPGAAVINGSLDEPYASGTIFGITQSTSRSHLIRAALEAVVYQVRGSYDLIKGAYDVTADSIRVSGGGANNEFIMEFLADILGITVERTVISESSVLGAAFLAGLATGFWDSMDETKSLVKIQRSWQPRISSDKREYLIQGWLKAIDRSNGGLRN